MFDKSQSSLNTLKVANVNTDTYLTYENEMIKMNEELKQYNKPTWKSSLENENITNVTYMVLQREI